MCPPPFRRRPPSPLNWRHFGGWKYWGNQHFLLSPYCQTFTLRNLRTFDEERSYKAFCFIRWPDTEGRPTCVRCAHSNCWEIRRRRFKCQACRREFSVTPERSSCSGR
ncbi:transposase [Agrobacterium tumefaciens]|uniref:transposase n=1 Tax=Agrobacterium tumefaciens TaxID=358 RepID=UPI0015759741|nr:hypothetical protein [Agrobacterium sp. ICMP 6402]NTZ89271.1 transposase [Agrobacterium tumefaciens]